MIDIDDPGALPELRRFIVSVGLDPSGLTDDEVRARVRVLLDERVPAPAVGFGDGPINGREWFAAALTAGGFRQPEDRDRRAVVDAGEPVHLVVLAILVMRHLSNARPQQPWTDESLAAQSGQPVEDFARAQRLLDEVAADVGGPPAQVLSAWVQERFELVVSPLLRTEAQDVLARPKLRRWVSHAAAQELVQALHETAILANDPPAQAGLTPDPDNDYLIALARSADVAYLVSGTPT